MVAKKRFYKKSWRKLVKKWQRNHKAKAVIYSMAAVAITAFALLSQQPSPKTIISPAAYQPLLDLIAKVESRDNYNAYFGSPNNTSVRFTSMTIAEVLDWQANYVSQGSPSNAVGKYQIIRPTLEGLVGELNLSPNTLFDQATQDKLAIKLIERRGSISYVNNQLNLNEFAANLAKEWAALPKTIGPNPQESYYASDGINRSLITIDEVFSALKKFKELA